MGDYWKNTADMFSSLFEKPKMSEKLLCKPPFKYIFDIITETTKTTGFAQGLFSEEESNSTYYQTKKQKKTFLKKTIDLVQAVTKEEI